MSNSNNPFAEALKVWGFDKYSEHFSFDKAVAAGRQNAKAFGDAAKAASDGFQLIANRQAALIQKQAEEASKFFSSFSSAKSPESALEQITKAAKSNTESAIASSKEVFEVVSKSASEATEILSKRLSSALSEINFEAYAASPEKQKKNAA
jgi:phasin family protein